MAALRRLHDPGCRTLAHIEPHPSPSIFDEALSKILAEVRFVDHIFFSGWNYNSRVSQDRAAEGFYLRQSRTVQRFCAQNGIDCELA